MTFAEPHSRVRLMNRVRSCHSLLRIVIHAAVVDEGLNRDQLRQFGHTARMVGVKMRHQQEVDAGYAGVFRGGKNPLRVTRLSRVASPRSESPRARKSRVNEQRLASRSDDEGGLPAFHIDEVDIERLSRLENRG